VLLLLDARASENILNEVSPSIPLVIDGRLTLRSKRQEDAGSDRVSG
jgi:hypothetical protein